MLNLNIKSKLFIFLPLFFLLCLALGYLYQRQKNFQNLFNLTSKRVITCQSNLSTLSLSHIKLQTDLASSSADLSACLATDQALVNKNLDQKIKEIKAAYKQFLKTYELSLEFNPPLATQTKIQSLLASSINFLASENYASASAVLVNLNSTLMALKPVAPKEPSNLVKDNAPPASGLKRQSVEVDGITYWVDIIAANLSETKVVVDTASDGDCKDNCPVKSLSEFATRSGAFAAINGPYFCPSTYPTCAGKKNSFDTLLLNKNKTYFNSDNNVYSSVPAAIFSTTSRFVAQSSEWGRDTSVDSVIAGQPLLVFNGQATFSGDGDPKKTSIGNRSFIGATDNTVYIGIVHSATVAQVSRVLAKMGIKNALNLDSGGSTGLWSGGKYLATPGRDTPFGILLIRR